MMPESTESHPSSPDCNKFWASLTPVVQQGFPPKDLIEQWKNDWDASLPQIEHIARKAAAWGADQELAGCAKVIEEKRWFVNPVFRISELCNARRPKPMSPKEQALTALKEAYDKRHITLDQVSIITRALDLIQDGDKDLSLSEVCILGDK